MKKCIFCKRMLPGQKIPMCARCSANMIDILIIISLWLIAPIFFVLYIVINPLNAFINLLLAGTPAAWIDEIVVLIGGIVGLIVLDIVLFIRMITR